LEKRVDAELKKLDPDLYLDKERDVLDGYIYYTVRYFIGSGVEPFTSVEWKDAHGPIDLSLNIIEFVKRNEGDIREDIAKVTAHNAAIKEKARMERDAAYEEVVKEFAKLEKTDYWRSLPREQRIKNKHLRGV
jgi:hypothetical protein